MRAAKQPPKFGEQIYWLSHPAIWASLGFSVFLVAWLIPPRTYMHMFVDRTYVYLDWPTLYFNCGCILALFVGYKFFRGTRRTKDLANATAISPLQGAPISSVIVYLGGIAANLIAIFTFARFGGVSAWRAVRSGVTFHEELRDLRDSSGIGEEGQTWMVFLNIGVTVAPLLYLMMISEPRKKLHQWLFAIFLATFFLAAFFLTKRNPMAITLLGLLGVHFLWPVRWRTLSQSLSLIAFAGGIMVTLFLVLAFVRIGKGGSDSINEVTRYLITPYSTEAAIINGVVSIDGSGNGYYWTEWIWKFPVLSDAFGLEDYRQEMFGNPAPTGFGARGALLKDQGITTVTSFPAFACSYVDFGWFGIVPFFFLGIVAAFGWRSFLRCGLFGLIFYPQIMYAFVDFRGNLLFPRATQGYTIILFLLIGLSIFLERRMRR